MFNTIELKLGCDPELFVFNETTGKYVSPRDLGFKGTKEEPVRLSPHSKVQVDGLALEFNIEPCSSAGSFSSSINQALRAIDVQLIAAGDRDGNKYTVHLLPFAKFCPEYFKEVVHPEDKILGCSPDFNIAGRENKVPRGLTNKPVRTAAGHIHIGWTDYQDTTEGSDHFQDCLYVAKKFHETGMFNPTTTAERSRLKFYGDNGSFRPKPYGVELRAPSNLWVGNNISRQITFSKVYSVMCRLINQSKEVVK